MSFKDMNWKIREEVYRLYQSHVDHTFEGYCLENDFLF